MPGLATEFCSTGLEGERMSVHVEFKVRGRLGLEGTHRQEPSGGGMLANPEKGRLLVLDTSRDRLLQGWWQWGTRVKTTSSRGEVCQWCVCGVCTDGDRRGDLVERKVLGESVVSVGVQGGCSWLTWLGL